MSFVFADRDTASYRTQQKRREKDLAFLERLRTAAAEELDAMLWNSKGWPRWRQVALQRAIARRTG